ncbi:hypothetical protein FACS1894219_02830 [Clostridia bacterium]|nr:hypothetical protein FACS1894219_02830 [Clostridia bacterium]
MQKQTTWDKLPKPAKVILVVVGSGLFIALLIWQAANGAGLSCH